MKHLIEKHINKQDKLLISSVTNQDLDELISEIKDWSIFNNHAKHIVTKFDEKGMHLLRCVLAEKIVEREVTEKNHDQVIASFLEKAKNIKN